MTWQEAIAAAVAVACAVWVLRTTLRPFVSKVASACGTCPGCGPPKAEGPGPARDDLVQIAPVDDGGRAPAADGDTSSKTAAAPDYPGRRA